MIKKIVFLLMVFSCSLFAFNFSAQSADSVKRKVSEEDISSSEPVGTGQVQKMSCSLTFQMKSWSIIYKNGKGTGVITCSNGESKNVKITMHGGGFTIGKRKVSGKGKFTPIYHIESLYGSYAYAEGHAGVKKSAGAQVVTNGKVSLTFTATGEGFNFGVDLGKFKIEAL